jgi:hypothetical protein
LGERSQRPPPSLTGGDPKLALGNRLLALLALGPAGGGVLDVIRGVLFVRHGGVVVLCVVVVVLLCCCCCAERNHERGASGAVMSGR